MDMQILHSAEGLPNGCTLCHTHTGPFVLVPGITFFDVPTADGLAAIEGSMAFCVGADDPGNPAIRPLGCARLIGQLADCLAPAEADGLRETTRAALARAEELHHETQRLEQAVTDAEAKHVQVVALTDLQEILRGDTAAPAVG